MQVCGCVFKNSILFCDMDTCHTRTPEAGVSLTKGVLGVGGGEHGRVCSVCSHVDWCEFSSLDPVPHIHRLRGPGRGPVSHHAATTVI